MTTTLTPPAAPVDGGQTPPAGTTAPATSSASTNTGDWTSGLSADMRGYVQNKGFKDASSVLDSYINLEKLVGSKDKLLKLPEKEDDPAWTEVFDKLGRPKEAKDYKIDVPKEFGDEKFAEWAKGKFHEVGLTTKQAEKLASGWNEYIKGGVDKTTQDIAAQVQAQQENLKKEWGAAHDQNIAIGQRAFRELGIDAATVDKLQEVLGFDGTMKFMHSVGSKFGEDSFVSSKESSGFNVMSPEAAMNKISALKQDNEFMRRYFSGGAVETDQWTKLHQWAFPQQ